MPGRLARSAALLLAVGLVGGCSAGATGTGGRARTPSCAAEGADASATFFAVMAWAHGAVEAVSLSTGKPVCQVAPGTRDGLTVAGVSRTSQGSLLVTYSRGPACTSGVSGCGPRPRTCGGEVVEIRLADAQSRVVWRAGRDELLRAAALSPDGTTLAARVAPCVPSYFNDHLLFRVTATGRSWTIGAGVPRCHWIGAPQWNADCRHVLITYAAPESTKPYSGPDGTSSELGDSSLVRIDATHPSAQVTGAVVPPPPACTWRSASVTATATYAIQACGRDVERLDGSAGLVELTAALRPARRWPIGECTDGGSLAADPVKGVILSAYLSCNPPRPGQETSDPVTVLDHLDGDLLQRVASTGGGATAWEDLSW